jgi:hypothetical protein
MQLCRLNATPIGGIFSSAGDATGSCSGYWLMYQPPLGEMTWPVMNFASSLAR